MIIPPGKRPGRGLLAEAPATTVDTAWEFPTPQQIDGADVLVFYQRGRWDDDRAAAIDPFLARGGGLVYIHWAVDGRGQQDEMAKRIGLSALGGGIRYRHGELTIDFTPGAEHPIARNFEQHSLGRRKLLGAFRRPVQHQLAGHIRGRRPAAAPILDDRARPRPRVRLHPRPLFVDVRRPNVPHSADARDRLGRPSQRGPFQRTGDAGRAG